LANKQSAAVWGNLYSGFFVQGAFLMPCFQDDAWTALISAVLLWQAAYVWACIGCIVAHLPAFGKVAIRCLALMFFPCRS